MVLVTAAALLLTVMWGCMRSDRICLLRRRCMRITSY
jgi:hypothetical protein